MGCKESKLLNATGHSASSEFSVDDSIHRMLKHSQGGGQPTYVPRAEHPLLASNYGATVAAEEPDDKEDCNIERDAVSDEKAKREMALLMYHAEHHNDTIDPRDYCDGRIHERVQ